MFRFLKINVLMFLVEWTDGAAVTCGLDQYTLKDGSGTVQCMNCSTCRPGWGSTPQCGAFLREHVEIKCEKCAAGKSYSVSQGFSSCESCTICVENEIVIKNCTPTSNTICGKCKPGHYRSFVHSCEKCSPCCEDTQDEDIEQQCLNQGFPKHSACRYTDRKCKTVASNPTSGLTTNHFEKDKQTSSSITWYIVGGLGLILLIAAVISIFFICRKKKKDPSLIKISQQESGVGDGQERQQGLSLYAEQNQAVDEA